ncbi:MAG: phosphatidylserine decarboxylase family protein [Bacteroidetes bacterium]|nr:MAG: phosphatidylserine decarboxylase family protein [Bacteroidota bacterium]
MTIHREGYQSLLLVTVVLGILYAGVYFGLPTQVLLQNIVLVVSIILFLIVLQFFRNPVVQIQANPNEVLAPADGKVVVIEETIEQEYFRTPRKQVSIFMSPINVHVNRNPISGIVKYFKYHPGKYLFAWNPKSSTENERTTTVVQHENGTELLFRQIAGALARRICWYVKERQIVRQGEEFGFIKFGSRVDIFLPLDAEITVGLNQITQGGKTVIAILKK